MRPPRSPSSGGALRAASLALLVGLAVGGPRTAIGGPAAPPEVVEATLEWEPSPIGPQTVMTLPLSPQAPEGVTLPTDLVEARYARIRWGSGPGLAFAVDVSPSRPRLWVDTDLNGSLLDEARSEWTRGPAAWTRSETVRVLYEGEGPPEEVPIRLEHPLAWEPDKVRIVPDGHRAGTVVLAGRVRRVALADRNADLRFDDAERDRLYLDLDGDGLLNVAETGHERIEPGQPVRVGAQGWIAEVASPSGRRVRFRRAASTPPPRPRTWMALTAPAAGVTPAAPTEPYEEVVKRLEAEAALPYAQRAATIALLGRFSSEGALKRLLLLVDKESDVNVRSAAVRALGNAAWLEKGGPALLRLVADPQPSAAAAALDALHGMGHPGREPLYRAGLEHASPIVVGAAARNLGYLGTPGGREALLRAFEHAKDGGVRTQVWMGLRQGPDGPPLALVPSAARDESASLRQMGLQDAFALEVDDLETLAVEAAAVRPVTEFLAGTAIDILGAIGTQRAVQALLDLAAQAPSTLDVRLMKALAPVREPGALAAMLAGLKGREAPVRSLCAQVLAGVKDRAVADALMARVGREKDPLVLGAVLEALGDQGDARAQELLLAQAKGKAEDVRRAAIRALARMGLHDEAVRAFFTGLLAARDWEDRVLALDAVAVSRDATLAPKVAPSVEHERIAVRLAAVEALGRLRAAAGIPPLIARLEREEEPRVRDALAHALYGLTGMNLYDDLSAWQRWWAAHGAGFVPPASVPPLPAADAGGTQSGFYGIPVSSGRVVFVIDQSGSMSAQDADPKITGAAGGTRLDVAVREVLRAIKGMKDRDQVNVVLFHTVVLPWRPDLQRLGAATRAALEKHLLDQQPLGGTNLYDALAAALDTDGVDTVFLLSDGAPGLGRYVATDDILRAVRRTNQTRRIALHAVSIGRDSDLMQRLAAENGGQYVRR